MNRIITHIQTENFDYEPYTDVYYYSYSNYERKLELVISVYDYCEVIWTRNPDLLDLPIPHPNTTRKQQGDDIWWTVETGPFDNFFSLDFTEFNEYLLGLTNVSDFVYNSDALAILQMEQKESQYETDNGGSSSIH